MAKIKIENFKIVLIIYSFYYLRQISSYSECPSPDRSGNPPDFSSGDCNE